MDDPIWITSERISMTKTMPTSGASSHHPVISATTASAPPSGREPLSPMKTRAGYALYQRNPISDPAITKQNVASAI